MYCKGKVVPVLN